MLQPIIMSHSQQPSPLPSQPGTTPCMGVSYNQPNSINYIQNIRQQGPPPRWPVMNNQSPRSYMPTSGGQGSSALIAQLTTPPTMGIGQFVPRMDNNSPGVIGNSQMNMPGLINNRMGPQVQGSNPGMNINMMNPLMTPQPTPNQQNIPQTQPNLQSTGSALQTQSFPPQQGTPPAPGSTSQGQSQSMQQGGNTGPVQGSGYPNPEKHTIWQGVLEWIEKAKAPNDSQKITRHVPCQVSANPKDGEPDLKADTWPQKLIMQLMPKQLIGNIGGAYLKNSRSVLFHPQPCEALESLTKVMSNGFAGCVHFTSIPSPAPCEIKVLILLYTIEKRAFLGFIPNDQAAIVDRLRKVIQQQKTSHAMIRQGQVPGNSGTSQSGVGAGAQQPGSIGSVSGGVPQSGQQTSSQSTQQGNIMISQTNTIAMGGGQITQNIVTLSAPQMQQQVVSLEHPGGGRTGSNQSSPVQLSGMQFNFFRKADTWPQKLIMQLMPKQLIGNIGGAYLKNSRSVLFHPQPCEALESLKKVMSNGFAGCVHFTSIPSPAPCEIKVLILLYTIEKRAFLGFIPNDQAAIVDRLRKVIQQQKTSHAMIRQGQVPGNSGTSQSGVGAGAQQPGSIGSVSGGVPQSGQQTSSQSTQQGNIMISQTNTIAMGGGQITQNIVTLSAPQMQPQVVSLEHPGGGGTGSNQSSPVQLSGMQQPQYRQQQMLQMQQMGGPRNQQQMCPPTPGPPGQQFDDVSNFDFLN